MAFYKVTLEGDPYVNLQLCCAAYRIGSSGLVRELANGTFKQKQFFDDILYSVDKSSFKKFTDFDAQTDRQNIDAFMANVEVAEIRPSIVIPKKKIQYTLEYGGFRFVRIVDITDPRRYYRRPRMAALCVCGSIYIALNAKGKDQENPVVVSIEE